MTQAFQKGTIVIVTKDYTLFIKLPMLNSYGRVAESGDVTICTLEGKYRTFFWGSDDSTPKEKEFRLENWLAVLESQGILVSNNDRGIIKRAVLDNQAKITP